MQLYNFWRSGTSHRLRIALNLKGLSYDYVAIHLGKNEHQLDNYRAINPQKLVPALNTGEDVLIQSPAILEWLEETYPTPPLLPSDPILRQRVRALAAIVGCDIHPINNKRILDFLRQNFNVDEAAIHLWCSTWITSGFDAYEAILRRTDQDGGFSVGDTPTLADCYLIPQIESARRFKVDVARWPLISAVETQCLGLPAFAKAVPALQPDAA